MLAVMVSTGGVVFGQAKPKKVQLYFWDMVWGPAEYIETAKSLVNKFNAENPTIEVVYQSTPWANFTQAFMTAVASGAALDVSTGSGMTQTFFADKGAILPVDSIIEDFRKTGEIKEYTETALNQFKYKGVQVGIPWNYDTKALVYNKALFRKAGIEKPATDLDGFFAQAVKLKNAGITPVGVGLTGQHGSMFFYGLARINGGGLWNQKLEPMVTEKATVDTMDYLRKMYAAGLFQKDVIGNNFDDIKPLFAQGKVAIAYSLPMDFNFRKSLGDDFEIYPPIKGTANDWPFHVVNHALMGWKHTKYPEETKEFMKWWLRNSVTLWSVGHSDNIPARKSFQKDPFFTNNKYAKYIIEQMIPSASPRLWPLTELIPAGETYFAENPGGVALQEAFSSNEPSAAILKRFADKLRRMVE